MGFLRRLIDIGRGRTARRLLVVVFLIVAWQAWIGIQAVGKVAPGVGAHPDSAGRFPVDVVLEFKPERYHILRLQRHGRVAGTDGTTVHLRAVSPAGTRAIAREYWVAAVTAPKT